jgi:type IV pilus assembly protein PilC
VAEVDMLFSPRLSSKALAELLHRLAVETEAGIDIRRTWQREAEVARGRVRASFAKVRDAVAHGETLSDALRGTGGLLPPLVLEMIDVGEKTGSLGRVYHRLADHYRRQAQMQRAFLGAIAWPAIELALALGVVGILIWVMGMLAARNGGQPIDLLGFGLVGTRGLLIYVNVLIVAGLCGAGLVAAARRGVFWTRPLQRALMHLPGLGRCLESLALARLTWSLHLVLNVEMDLRRVVPLALRSTGNDYYIRRTRQVVADVGAGMPLHEAFRRTGAFPQQFIDALQVAEESGETVESMGRLADRYNEESEAALHLLTVIAGFAVWAIVAALIVVLIFNLAGFYLRTLNDALRP